MTRFNAGVFLPHLFKDSLPQVMRESHGIGLIAHAHALQTLALRVLKRESYDALHTFAGVDVFLDSNFVSRALLKKTANSDIQALGIFAKNYQANIFFRAPVQRRKPLVEKFHWSRVHVQIQLESQAEQDIRSVLIARHTRIAERSKQNRVEFITQHFHCAVRQADAIAKIFIRAPIKLHKFDGAARGGGHRLQNFQRLRRDFFAYAVAWNDVDSRGATAPAHWRLLQGFLHSSNSVRRSVRVVSFSIRSRRGVKPMPGPCGTVIVPRDETVTSGSMISSCQ